MKLIRELPHIPIFSQPAITTVGNFDGVHIGHQAVLDKLLKTSKDTGHPSIVLSFENHPAEILRPDIPICKICTSAHKTLLMEKMGVDALVLLSFSKEFSEQSAEEFLLHLKHAIPFSHLILGWDASLGKNKHGNKAIVQDIAQKQGFKVEYLDQEKVGEVPVSSSQIRNLIQSGRLEEVKKFLGRDYSIYTAVYKGEGRGKKIGFPTANFQVKGLCLPPLGVYAVTVTLNQNKIKGIANLGIAPTVRNDQIPVLEVHLFDFDGDLYGQSLEVTFVSFLRPEKKFLNIDELKSQISFDISTAKLMF